MQIIAALGPIFGLIMLGLVLKRSGFPGDAFWPLAARLTYFVFFPCLIAARLATTELGDIALGSMALAQALPVLLIALLMLLSRRLWRFDDPAYTSLFQGSIRMNTYVGLAGAAALLGDRGLALASLALGILIPLVNVLSVAVLNHYVARAALRLDSTLWSILKTPPVAACVVGITLNLSGLGLPPLIGEVVEILSRAALPVGLLTVGAALDVLAVRVAGPAVLVVAGLKLLLLPLLTLLACGLLGVEGETRLVVILFAALPGAPAAYLLAQELGGDVRLMAGILTVQTALAAVTMPLVGMWW